MRAFRNCFSLKKPKPGFEEPSILAAETHFTVNKVEALHDLFKKLSSSVIDDGLIHKEEFQLAFFNNSNKQNFFLDRLFDLFDIKRNGAIVFGEFVLSLSVFHPRAPEADKISYLFRLYDIKQTRFIERDELKEMVSALLSESDLSLSIDAVESIVDKVSDIANFFIYCVSQFPFSTLILLVLVQTVMEANLKCDGKIDEEEWKEFVTNNPYILKNMTLPYLNFILNTDVTDLE